ncbi:hypothetical protein RN001_011135 [Aquatica leii]|uniref:NAD-dependent protein deacylase n=1 Tax=Aquatica leii TaxID=1421715 RepID=A0AAN7PVN3_9COLE|nr:hypothetical protein RN001_011135 [Aquatica leii]
MAFTKTFKSFLINLGIMAGPSLKISDFAGFRKVLDSATKIAVLTGAGVSAESGIGTFRGPAGMWRTHNAMDLATLKAFEANPSLVWEFYEWRRSMAFNARPNKAHLALVEFENKCIKENRVFTLMTQNVDGLHIRAGSKNVFEIHGSLRKVKCTKCKLVYENTDVPICEALRGRGDPEKATTSDIPISDLPKCKNCSGLLRPDIVWFGEILDDNVLSKCVKALEACELFLVVGTSAIVYPAAGFAPFVQDRGVPVAEFNTDPISAVNFVFRGPCGTTLPEALGIDKE